MNARKTFRDAIHRRATRLAKLVELDAPDNILANEIRLVYEAGIGLCGAELGKAIAERQAVFVRQSFGFCRTCDTLIPPERAAPPACEQCEAREDTEFGDDA